MCDNLHSDAFEAALELVAATLEGEAEVSLNEEGAASVMEYFKGIYKGMCEIMDGGECECSCGGGEKQCECEREEADGEKSDEADDEAMELPEYEEVFESEEEENEVLDKGETAPDTFYRRGKFEIKETESGFSFNLKAGNGEIIATSEVYATRQGCLNGIESIKISAAGEIEDQTVENFETLSCPKFEVYKDKAEQYRFRLKASNGEIVAASEGYVAKASCFKGIDSIKRNILEAEIDEQ